MWINLEDWLTLGFFSKNLSIIWIKPSGHFTDSQRNNLKYNLLKKYTNTMKGKSSNLDTLFH